MQNIDVRFNATSNFGKVRADMAALQAQSEALNASFAKNAYAKPPMLVDTAAWRNGTNAIDAASDAYRRAASSSGLLTTQQIRGVSEAEKYTRALQKQKLGLRDMIRHQGIMKEVYRDQLRMQRMTAQYWGTDTMGRQITDITMPRNVPRDLDTWRMKMGMFGNMAASAGTQVVNLGKNMQWAGRQLTVGFTYPMVLFGAAAGAMAYKVDDAFSKINKVYNVSAASLQDAAAREKELGDLRVMSMENAAKAAQEYGVSIESTLDVQQQLAATGLNLSSGLLEATNEVQRISAIGGIDPTQTTEMVVALQTAFSKTIQDSDDLTAALNFMNAASNASSLSLQDLAEATPRAAASVAQAGGTIQDMAVILTSMREGGIKAAEAANAIKSVGTRIINPVPKAIDYYKSLGQTIEGASIDLDALSRDSGGNLLTFLRMFAEEEKKIQVVSKKTGKVDEKATQLARNRGRAMLFGTYQTNRLTASLVNVADAYQGVNNQTAEVIRLSTQSDAALAKQAASSQADVVESAAGRMRVAFQSFKVELAEIGEPFLDAATKILNVFTKIAGAFNSLSPGAKNLILITGLIMALVGPVVMLGGLFFNLTGQFIKGVGAISKFVGNLTLMTKEEQAAALTTESVNKALMAQTKATSTLTQELQVLAASYRAAQEAAQGYLGATAAGRAVPPPPVNRFGNPTGFIGPQTMPMPRSAGYGANYRLSSGESRMYAQTDRRLASSVRLEQARVALANEYMAANNQVARDATRTEQRQAASARATERIRNNLSGGAVAAGALSAGMLLTMGTSNETANNIGKFLILGALVVPAVQLLANGLKLVAIQAKAGFTWLVAQGAAARAAAGGNAMGAMVGGARGMAAALASSIGLMGALGLAAVAVGGAIYLWKKNADEAFKKSQEALKQQAEYQEQINSSAIRWGESVGKTAKAYKTLYSDLMGVSEFQQSQQTKTVEYYRNEAPAEGSDKNTVQGYNALSTEVERTAADVQMFQDLQYQTGLTANEAASNMEAFYIAAGESAIEAQNHAQKLLETWKQIDGFQSNQNNLALQVNAFNTADFSMGEGSGITGGQKDVIEEKAQAVAQAWNQAFIAASSPEEIQTALDSLNTAVEAGYNEAFNKIVDVEDYKKAFERLGIESGVALQKALAKSNGDVNAFMSQVGDALRANGMSEEEIAAEVGWVQQLMIPQLEGATEIERILLSAVGSAAGMGTELRTVTELMTQLPVRAKTLSFEDQKLEIRDLANAYFGFTAEQKKEMAGLDADGKKNYINRVRGEKEVQRVALANALQIYGSANNIKLSGKLAQDLAAFMAGVTNEAGDAADATNRVASNLDNIRDKNVNIVIKTSQLGGIFQGAIENVQDNMVDRASYLFENTQQAIADDAAAAMQAESDALQDRQEAVSRALQDRQEAASRALQARQEAAMRAFEAKWEKKKNQLTKFYDDQIKDIERVSRAEEKADEVRARLYEKEKKRLTDLAEAANSQIDFDIAINTGNLDEAAKLQNSAEAKGMSDQMDAEQRRAEQQTQDLIERLDKKRERLEKARDKALKRLEKVEERMRRSLEKMQEAQQRALQKQQEAQQRALEKSQQAQSRALQQQQDAEKRAADRSRELARQEFDYKMELFKSLPAANKKQLEAALKASGLTLKDFGFDVLDGKKGIAGQWGAYFQKYLDQGLRQGAADAAKSNMWEGVTDQIAKKMLRGFGFSSLASFEKFVKTGKKGDVETRHGGGEIGSGDRQSRAGLGGGGLHRTETMIRAQKGEYVINRKAYAQNRDLVRGINNGKISGSAYRASSIRNQEAGTRRITEGLGALPSEATGISDGVAHLGYGYGTGYRAMVKGMGPGLSSGIDKARARFRAERAARRRERMQQQNPGNTSNIPIGDTGPITDLGRSALAWAADHRYGDALGDWYNRCLSFVRQSLGAAGGVYNANASWAGAKYKRGIKNYNDVPAGVPVFWYGGANGHVILSAGNGRAIGTDNTITGQALPTTIADVASWWGQAPSGWSADINGKQVYPLRRGGTIKYDNTLISAHKGETVLPARLTEQFKNNVRSGGGGDTYQVTLDLRGAMIKEEVDIEKAVYAAIDKKESKLGRRRTVRDADTR